MKTVPTILTRFKLSKLESFRQAEIVNFLRDLIIEKSRYTLEAVEIKLINNDMAYEIMSKL